MNRYWDLSPKEQSELASEQVEALLTVEMMEKGVVKPEEPTYLPVEELPEPDIVLYAPKAAYSSPNFGYRTPEQAARLMADAVCISTDYISGTSVSVIGDREVEIAEVRVYSKGLLAENRILIEKNAAAKKQNDAAEAEYKNQQRKATEATSGVWDDYYSRLAEARSNKKIIDTFNEYVHTCSGDRELAYKFLLKAYSRSDVNDAFDWFGVDIPAIDISVPVSVEAGTEAVDF